MAAVHDRLGLVPIINAAGTMTDIGASRAVPEAVSAVAEILPEFIDIADLQCRASAAIAAATGAEAGFVTSSAASGITLGIAGAMTGSDLAAVARLPDTDGLACEVIVPAGHLVDFGAPVAQMIRLAGAVPVAAGTVFDAQPFHLAAALSPRTAACLYVVSHHTAQSGQIGLARAIDACHSAGVPVIVDMAAEYDLRRPFDLGADLAIWSAQKFLGGPTAGIVAGRADLVRAAWLQGRGIGRAMKVGKEGIAGAIAALETWRHRDHEAARGREAQIVGAWLAALRGSPGLGLRRLPDWTGNPVERLEITVGREAGLFAWELADRLAARNPSIRVRDDLVGTGAIHLDPCNLEAPEAAAVAAAIRDETGRSVAAGDGLRISWEAWRESRLRTALSWPERP